MLCNYWMWISCDLFLLLLVDAVEWLLLLPLPFCFLFSSPQKMHGHIHVYHSFAGYKRSLSSIFFFCSSQKMNLGKNECIIPAPMWFNLGREKSVKIKQTPLRVFMYMIRCMHVYGLWVCLLMSKVSNDRYVSGHKRETRFVINIDEFWWWCRCCCCRFNFNFELCWKAPDIMPFFIVCKNFSHTALISSRLVVKHIPFEKSFDVCVCVEMSEAKQRIYARTCNRKWETTKTNEWRRRRWGGREE